MEKIRKKISPKNLKRSVKSALKRAEKGLKPSSKIHEGLSAIQHLIGVFYQYLENFMDKKIRKIKKEMSSNLEKLAKEDEPRDRKLKKCAKIMKKRK